MSLLAELGSGAIGGLLGGIGTLAKDIRQAITGDLPVEKQAEINLKLMELENSVMLAQADINKIEAGSEHWFVAAWRPFVGWMCGIAFAYATILDPLLRFAATLCGWEKGFPVLDTTLTMQALFAILGVGIMRSYDKKQAPSVKGAE